VVGEIAVIRTKGGTMEKVRGERITGQPAFGD